MATPLPALGGHGFPVPRYLTRSLDVRSGEQVVEVNVQDGVWEVRTECGTRKTAAALLLTAPVPQALTLVGSGGFELSDEARYKLKNISYAPCLALMALPDARTGIPEPGGMQIKDEPLDWIGDNQCKGISEAPGITVHAGPEWSSQRLEADEAEITASLLSLAGEQPGSDLASKTVQTSITRWRYSWVTHPHPEPCLVASEGHPLLFSRDAFGEAKVEGAALSDLSAANRLRDRNEG
jgi:renalase